MDPSYALQLIVSTSAWGSLGLAARLVLAQRDARRRTETAPARRKIGQ